MAEVRKSKPGDLLRYWRQTRGFSQLDLAMESGISQRHISFVESGRSLPSRDLLRCLSRVLDVPLRERNALLLHFGYAPQYEEGSLDSAEMALVRGAVERVLQQQEPYPALVLDRHWNVLKTNEAARRFFGSLVDLSQWPAPRNLLRLTFDPAALRPYVEDWEYVAAGLLERVHREAVGRVLDTATLALIKELKGYPGADKLPAARSSSGPVIPVTFAKEGQRWSWFSLVTTVGTPQWVSAQELRIECMFPVENGQLAFPT